MLSDRNGSMLSQRLSLRDPTAVMSRFIDLGELFWKHLFHLDAFLRPQMDRRLWPLLSFLARQYRRRIIPRKRLVAVVGSLGKSTTVRVLRAGLLPRDHYQSFSNYGSRLAENVLRSRPWDPYDVLEIGIAGPDHMGTYAELIRPNIVVVTSICSDHNRSFPTLADTRKEKVKMVQGLSSEGVAVLNGDDPNVFWMASQTPARVLTYGTAPIHDVWASDLQLNWPTGSSFMLHTPDETRRVRSRLIGKPMMYAILAAVTVAVAEDLSLNQVIPKFEALKPTTGRMEPVALNNGISVLDDSFKGPLESYHAALDVFSDIPAKRRIVVIGGISEPQGPQGPLYKELGKRIAGCADLLLFVPRGTHFREIRSGAIRGGMPRESILHASSSIEKAVEILNARLEEGDVVLLKGPSSNRYRRILLKLQGKKVLCAVKGCRVKVHYCEECPLVEQDTSAISNSYIVRLLKT